jgi:ABC-type nickel/cobalt efflux system permease component RcnA
MFGPDGVMAAGAAEVSGEVFGLGLLATAFVFGLRHGIDWDHIAAITDITGSQEDTRASMVLSSIYALGHAAVVLVLGTAAVLAGEFVPESVDSAMEKVVGVTLLVLGIYVFYSLFRHGRDFRMRSRWMLIFSGARRGARWLRGGARTEPVVIEHVHEHVHDDVHDHAGTSDDVTRGALLVKTKTHRHRHSHLGVMPRDPFENYSRATALGVGMLHGVGAETPTQVLLFLAASQAGGRAVGILVLVVFLTGLFVSNTAVALASTFGFLRATRNFGVYATVAVITAAFSLGLGALYLFSKGDVLPALLGG